MSVGVGGGLGRVAPPNAAPPLAMQPQLELSGVVTRAAMHIFSHAAQLGALSGEGGANCDGSNGSSGGYGHADAVQDICFNRMNEHIISVGSDRAIKLWRYTKMTAIPDKYDKTEVKKNKPK